MSKQKKSIGFSEDFLGLKDQKISLLNIVKSYDSELAELLEEPGQVILDYQNYSVIMDRERKFPILTASNIDGKLFKSVARAGSWKKDDRIAKEAQWGLELYNAEKSDFDKGHLTKREDVQWAKDAATAMEAAKSTFYYTNAVPQHARLNRAIWRRIESYILKSEAVKHDLRIAVLTGPVLDKTDPEFVTTVDNEAIKIPVLFWKIVYYLQGDDELFRTAFLVSQKELLERERIVKKSGTVRSAEDKERENYFLRFKKAETYQVKVDLVEELTGLNFPVASENFEDDRPNKLIVKEVNVRGEDGMEMQETSIRNLVI